MDGVDDGLQNRNIPYRSPYAIQRNPDLELVGLTIVVRVMVQNL